MDVERDTNDTNIERKITLKGTSQQLSAAKKLIEEKVEDSESLRERMISSRKPRVRQPLFLSYQDDAGEEPNVGDIGKKLQTKLILIKTFLCLLQDAREGFKKVLELLGGDDELEVFVISSDFHINIPHQLEQVRRGFLVLYSML